ncbi:glycosyltransferase family 4 protein [bacterium]|nr:glycosyltransferase family 4 protein [bacterium]
MPASSTTIRVGHILDGRHFGGAEQMVRRLAEASPRADIEAHVYCLSEGRLAEFLRQSSIPLRIFPSSGRFDFRFLSAMARAARADGLHILQAHTSRTHLIARILSRRLRIPNITTIQSPIALDENRAVKSHPLRATVERLGRRWTDAICPVSREETERLAREENVPREMLHWIPNGIEPLADAALASPARRDALNQYLASESLPADAFTIVMIAQMRPRKGPETLLRAFAKLNPAEHNAVLILIGDDEFTEGMGYLDRLRALAGQLGISTRMRFTGFMADPWALAGGADLMALPSLFGEGMPLVLLEAMNHALPIAVSDIQGNRELIDAGRNGWLHAPGDAGTLAGQLAEAAADPAATAAKGAIGRELFLKDYTLDSVVARHRQLYELLVDRGS